MTTIGHLDRSRPHSRGLRFGIDDARWDGRPLRWDCELVDPMFLRLATAAGWNGEADHVFEGFPVTLTLRAEGCYYKVVQVEPARAGRSRNGLFWVRLAESTPAPAPSTEAHSAKPSEPAKVATPPPTRPDPITAAFGFGHPSDVAW